MRRVVIDGWSWLNYKPVFADEARGMPNRRAFPEAAASWVPAADERRLAAYKLLAAYDQNQSAELAGILDSQARERREFGDPAMFIDTVMAHVLGREQHITVTGADDDSGGQGNSPDTVAAARVQDLLREWAETELLPMRVQQTERKAVSLGDGVYRLAWDPAKQRATVRAVDPGFYFPVLPEDGDGEFPDRVHFAWELPEDPKRQLKARLRRITYELAPIGPATAAGVDEQGRAVRAPVTVEGPDGQLEPTLGSGDTVNVESGAVTRVYSWNDQPSAYTCYLTDATWELGDLKGPVDVDDLPLAKAQFATRSDGEVLDRLDLMLDFIPVVHVPNTVPGAEEHWGQSSLAKVLQVFDELQGADTDSARAAATTGLPMVGISGADARTQYDVGPGQIWKLPENGKLTTIDTSAALRELREQRHDLADRASTNARLPAVTLGTLDPSKVPSGYAMELTLGPLDALVSSMRLARAHKYSLLLKMVQRLHLAGQHPDWTGIQVLPAQLVFGPYTPTDKAAVLEQVSTGYDGGDGVLSLETAVKMLMEAGFPIDDVAEEIERIQSRAFAAARNLADALGNVDEVAGFLGREAPDEPDTPPVVLPPAGQQLALDNGSDPAQNPDGEDPAQGSGGNTP